MTIRWGVEICLGFALAAAVICLGFALAGAVTSLLAPQEPGQPQTERPSPQLQLDKAVCASHNSF
jgi:hypothetical protein